MSTSIDVQALRAAEYPWMLTGETIYLNNASLGPIPLRAVRALDAFTQLRHQPQTITVPYQFGVLTKSRELAARLVGGSPDEIALMVNTSYGVNVALIAFEVLTVVPHGPRGSRNQD